MKTKILTLMSLTVCLCITISSAQQPGPTRHNLSLGPQFSYNLEQEKALFGAGAGYEFRLGKNWGFAANVNFNKGMTENPQAIFAGSEGKNLLNLANNNVSIGSRFYLKRFYLGASFGYGEERKKIQYADSRGTRWESERGFYQAYSIGYQIPVGQHRLEIFAGGGGIKDLNVTTGLRFNFGLSK